MKQHGFTLIELIVSLAIFSVIAVGVIVLVSAIFGGSNRQASLLVDTDSGRRASFLLTNELRNATSATTGAYPLATVDAQQLTFYSNIDNDALIERIRYYVQNGKLYRGIVEPTGNPYSYNPASESSSVVQNNVANGGVPLFYYYDDSYDGTTDTPLTQPVNASDVRFIKLNLRVFNRAGVQNSNYYTITSGASVRNLKTNLGD